MPPQFTNPVPAGALCVRLPHIPIQQVAERQGSGKLTLNKSGSSGTRVWQVPWFFYPAFCDWLLGRVNPSVIGNPELNRPDIFSPCYPWLYCQEASVEGEDLLGVDLSLRAFYRRAVVTAKYMPLELNNSIHVNSQMLTIPNTQFIFIGQNPTNLAGFQQIFGVELVGRTNGGTFTLGFANDTSAASFLTPAAGSAGASGSVAPVDAVQAARVALEAAQGQLAAATTDADRDAAQKAVAAALERLAAVQATLAVTPPIPWNASAAVVRDAVRQALGKAKPTDSPGAVLVSGPEKATASGPWIITLNVPEVKVISAPTDGNKLTSLAAGLAMTQGGNNDRDDMHPAVGPEFGPSATSLAQADYWWGNTVDVTHESSVAAATPLCRLLWSGKFTTGAFRFKFTHDAAANPNPAREGAGVKPNYSTEVACSTATLQNVYDALFSLLSPATKVPSSLGRNTDLRTPGRTERADIGMVSDTSYAFVSEAFLDGAPVALGPSDKISDHATGDPNRPLRIYLGLRFIKLIAGVTTGKLELVPSGTSPGGTLTTEGASVKLTKYDPYLANRLDQNVGKVVPMGEITIQRHQVIATDMNYLLAVVGSVNMFTFMGFPPWTLLLSGIEAKQTRLPNGTPCFDMTFKFAFNPYTHQAIFRPLFMRWEFVRGVLVARVPESVAVPKNPLDPKNSRVTVNPKAVEKAWAKPKPPREIPLAINPLTGKPVKGGAAGVASAPAETGEFGGGGDFPPPEDPAPDDFGGGGEFGGMASMKLGASNNNNSNPNAALGGVVGAALGVVAGVVGQVTVPFGTKAAADVEGTTTAVLTTLSQDYPADPNAPNAWPPDAWQNASDILGDMISRSIGIGKGQADEDQKAAASGIEADIEQGRLAGADWINTYDNGVQISTDSGGGGDFGSGNLEFDLALAHNAHECGAKLTARTREFLGLPPETPAAGAAGALGADPGSLAVSTAVAVATSAAKAVNVGAAKSIQQMSTRIFDLGFIYPICDFTPILWMQ